MVVNFEVARLSSFSKRNHFVTNEAAEIDDSIMQNTYSSVSHKNVPLQLLTRTLLIRYQFYTFERFYDPLPSSFNCSLVSVCVLSRN